MIKNSSRLEDKNRTFIEISNEIASILIFLIPERVDVTFFYLFISLIFKKENLWGLESRKFILFKADFGIRRVRYFFFVIHSINTVLKNLNMKFKISGTYKLQSNLVIPTPGFHVTPLITSVF